jgi:glutamate racemase
VPVVGVVEPGAAMASEVSKSRSAIVIATEATVSSHAYRDALQQQGLAAYEKACPLFVPLVEEGWIEHPVTEQVAKIYLGEALQQAPEQADVLVLACTHYPLIAPLLRRIAPLHMQIVDSAESTARVVKKMLSDDADQPSQLSSRARSEATSRGISENSAVILSEARSPLAVTERSRRTPINTNIPAPDHRTFRFYVTDSTDKFKRLATRFLGRQVDKVEHVDLGG